MIAEILNRCWCMLRSAHCKLAVLLLTAGMGGSRAAGQDSERPGKLNPPPSVRETEGGAAFIWRERHRLPADRREVRAVAFAPDGKTLATGGYDGAVRLWDLQTGRESAALRDDPHSSWVRALAFSPDGKTLAVAVNYAPPRLVFWDVPTKRARHIVERTSVTSLAFSPDGTTLATGAIDAPLKLWDATTGRERFTLPHQRHLGVLKGLAFSPDGKLLAAAFANGYPSSEKPNGEIDIWDLCARRTRFVLENRAGIYAVAFSPDGRMLATGGRFDNQVTLWEVATGQRRTFLRPPEGVRLHCITLAFAPDGKTLAATGADVPDGGTAKVRGGVVLWNIRAQREATVLKVPDDVDCSLVFAPDGKRFAAGSVAGTVTVWEAAEQRPGTRTQPTIQRK